jgi:hypothetical protein
MQFLKLLVPCLIISSFSLAQSKDSNTTRIDDTKSFALLHVYRPNNFGGSGISYNLYAGDSMICKVKNNSKYIIKLLTPGPITIWAKSGARYEVQLNVTFGENYYLWCGVNGGFPHATPYFAIKDEGVGQKEFESVQGKKDKTDDDKNASTNNH